jgi:hypothetical protein
MKRSWEISRRTFLGGCGAMVALPLLEAMAPAIARAQAAAAKRLVFWYVPCGIHMPGWTPASAGALALSPILQPLSSLTAQLTVITGLDNYAATDQGDGPGDHARGTGSCFYAAHVRKTTGTDIDNGISVDQFAAARVGSLTRFRSLELGIDSGGNSGDCDSGYSCAYARNISWLGPSTPAAKETNPQLVFDRLFAGLDTQATITERQKRRLYDQSVLDYVRADAQRLQAKLGAGDRQKLDEYLTGVRELELRIERDAEEDAPVCPVGARPASPTNYIDRIDQMTELMVLALQCDQTRLITFMTANAGSGRTFPHLNITDGHHELSHHQGDATKQAKLQQIDTWEVSMLGKFLTRLQSTTDATGTNLLDSSLVFFSSEIADGNSHSHYSMPVLLAGKGGGAVRPGRHIVLSPRKPIANLFISMLQAVGVATANFGDEGTAPLAELT